MAANDDPRRQAQSRYDQLRIEEEQLANMMDTVQDEMRDLMAFLRVYDKLTETPPQEPVAGDTIAEVAANFLRPRPERKARMTEIVQAVRHAGLFHGKPSSQYGTTVSALKRFPDTFEKADRGVWRLKE